MEPEISRRCHACGASVRSRARFCPQCGRDVLQQISNTTSENPLVESTQIVENVDVSQPARVSRPESVPAPSEEISAPQTHSLRAPVAAASFVADNADDQIKGSSDGGGGRAEALRRTSAAVLDEAAENAEVRFLLISVVLFLLFLILLIVTSVIK